MNWPAKSPLLSLFWVSAGTIAYEISITRYFAIASWSEYGYWVISIAMVGFAISGVILSLFSDFFIKRWQQLLFVIPLLLLLLSTVGFHLSTINPFNPLEFQNPDAWFAQLLNIWKYYAALFPVFFLAGLYVGLCFLAFQEDIPRVYAVDLGGAAAGALLLLALMYWVHPFYLLSVLLPCFALASAAYVPSALRPRRNAMLVTVLALFAVCELSLFKFNQAEFNQYKAIYPALHVQGSKVVEQRYSPRGYYMVLKNFTERLDTDLSNNLGLLALAEPPTTLGLYKDGQRIAALPKAGTYDPSYVKAALDSFPYQLLTQPRVLLIGTRGGFRVREALSLGASDVVALEPDDTLFQFVRQALLNFGDPVLRGPRVTLSNRSPVAFVRNTSDRFDLVEIASDFLDQADANKFAFTTEAVQGYFAVLSENGMVSVPVSMRELTVYAVKMLETARRALTGLGISDAAAHIIVYRSAWNARILLSKKPFAANQIERLRAFCEALSFDTSYFPGIDAKTVKIWNDLPAVSFADETVVSSSSGVHDALMEDSIRLLAKNGSALLQRHFFNLTPSTYDRPAFHSILRLPTLGQVLRRIALIPREELTTLINIAVIIQALVLAVVVLTLPLVRWRRQLPRPAVIVKSVVFFAALGLGFLFLEITLIDKASFFLNDRTYAFTIVLSGMLVFAGSGSYASSRYLKDPTPAIAAACGAVVMWALLAVVFLDKLLLSLLALPFSGRCAVVVVLLAPLSFALGMPFPLGLYVFRGRYRNFLPWAWSLNGAFSVIATPLASLLALTYGYRLVLMVALACYFAVYLSYPVRRGQNQLV
jgi:spermidine synthase